jgi:hypothetical protein
MGFYNDRRWVTGNYIGWIAKKRSGGGVSISGLRLTAGQLPVLDGKCTQQKIMNLFTLEVPPLLHLVNK